MANCAPLSATVVRCELGTLGGSGADLRDVVLRWRALGPGPTTISATAVLTADDDTNTANNTQTATTSVISGANLAIAKVGTPDPVVGGANLTYTLTVSNAGPNASGDIVITDSLPPSVSFVSAAGSGWTCNHSAGTVTCTRPGPHAAGAAIPAITLVGRVNAAGGTVTNSVSVAPATGGTADPDTANNTATASTTVLPGADIRIAQKSVISAVPAVAGSNVSFRIQPRNGGPATATNVVVTDSLPAGWTFVSATGPNWTCSNAANVVSCTRASMPTSAADDITVVAQAPGNAAVGPTGTNYTNTASIGASSNDPDAGNNSGSVNVNVLPDGADLRLAKLKTPNPVAQGANMSSSITVSNNGPRTATGPLRVVERLTGESFVSASGTGWRCDASAAPTIVCSHPNTGGLAVNASLPTLTIVTRADASGSVGNTACTGGSVPAGAGAGLASPPAEGDANPTNDCATATSTSTTVQPDLAISKVTSTPTGGDKTVSTSEGSVTYTLVVSNVSATPQAATGVVISDSLPAFVSNSSVATLTATPSAGSTAAFSCSSLRNEVVCSQSGGQLLQGQSVTVVIVVNRPLSEGSFTNTATVRNVNEGDPNPNNNSASDTVVIEPIADVEMTGKSVTPGTVRAGEVATYVLSFRNNGPSPALGVTVNDQFTFPGGDSGVTVTQITSSKAGSSCSIAAGAVLTPGSSNFSCTIGTLANGETQTITLLVRPNFQAGNPARSFGNLARVNTTSVENPAGGDNGNNERSATLAVTAAAVDLLVNKTDRVGAVNFDPVAYTAGSSFLAYQVSVNNSGPSYATGAQVTETMTPPAGKRVRFVCDVTTFGGSTCNPVPLCSVANVTSAAGTAIPAFTCSVPAGTASTGAGVGELAVGATKNIFLRFEVLDQPAPTGDIFNNVATVASNEPDTQAANNTENEQTTTRQRVDLRVSKTATVASPTLMQPFNWVITVINNGPGNALQTDLTDTLPAQAEVTGPITWTRSLQPANGNCTRSGVTGSCALGQLDSGGTATITVPVRITSYPGSGSVTNSATVDTDPTKLGGIDTPGGNNTGTSTVTVQRSSLAGTVFEDRVRSGANGGTPQAAAQEPRVANVTVTLTGTDAYGNAVSRSTTTDASGNYLFNNLAPSDGTGYTLTQTQPTGYDNGPVAAPAGSAGGTYAAGGGNGNSSHGGVVLGASVSGTNYNFPELRRVSLAGFVYLDANANNVRDAATDPAIAGAAVRLLNATDGSVLATATTAPGGSYSFTGLDPLVPYTLEQPLPASPAGLANGPVNPGLVGGSACASGCTAQPNTPAASTDRIASIDLSSGADGAAFNFGEVQLSSVSGLVWIDRDRDGTLGGAETGRLPGVTLRLVQGADCSTGTTVQTTTTAADGSYRFDNVRAFQNYLVCQTQPGGYGTGTANGSAGNVATVTNLAAAGSPNNNFGETVASLTGAVYADYSPATPANTDNGTRDAGETGIAGVPVTLTGTDINGAAVSLSTVTDASGNYSFDGLLQSDANGYTVTEGAIPPAAGVFNDGRDTAGSAGGSTATNDRIAAVVLGAGVQATGYLFGELPIAPITGSVYIDRDGSGTLGTGDGAIPGVTIRLVLGSNCSGTVVATTTTDASGNYSFSGVSAGLTYTLCEVQPTGYGEGSTNPGGSGSSGVGNAITISNLPTTGSAGNHFGERAATLSGSVYLDANNDGLRQGGESGIAGVTVTLSGSDAAGNNVTRTATTDAAGNYSFTDLLAAGPGGYTVTEQAAQPVVNTAAGPVTTIDGRSSAGSTGGSATAVGSTPSTLSGIALAAGGSSTDNRFGELLPVSISGTVFLDLDNNGLQDTAGDAGLSGIPIVITGTDDTGAAVTRNLVTGTDGRYSVADLRPGTYTVTEPTQPAGTSNGITTAGSAGGSTTPVATLPSAVAGIVLATSGATSSGNNFAEIPNNSSIEGRVWLDVNNNGLIDGTGGGTESGIAGVTIELTGTDTAGRSISRSTTTAADGSYSFGSLAPGNYALRQPTQPPATVNGSTVVGSTGGAATPVATAPSAITAVSLGVGAASVANNFGEVPAAGLSGIVYADNNNDGIVGAGEGGLPGVTLVLTGTDDLGNAVSLTTVTGADGRYSFDGLRPGTYTVTQPTQPAGTVNGITSAGTLGGTATGPGTVPSAIAALVLGPGAQALNNNFGEIGNSPDLRVSKSAVGAPFTVGYSGGYRLTVRNVGEIASSGAYTVSDRLPAGLTLAATPTGNGWVCSGAVGASSFSCSSSTVIAAGAVAADAITASVAVGAAAATASPVNNVVMVEGGGELPARGPSAAERDAFNNNPAALPVCTAAIEHNACRTPTPVQRAASVSGTVWYDIGSGSRVLDGGDRRLAGWLVEVVDPATGAIVGRATTDASGAYSVPNLLPGVPLAVRFREPGSGVVYGYPVNGNTAPGSSGATCNASPPAGTASSCVGTGNSPALTVVLAPGQDLPQQSLPVDPSGVVYDSGLRTPVPGSVVRLAPVGACVGWNPATALVGATLGGYTLSADAASMTVGSDGFYQFLFGPGAPASCTFGLTVTPPAGYTFQSAAIPPAAGPLVPGGGPGSVFPVQPQATAPTGAIGTATTYFLSLTSGSGGANIIHNHIPLDPALPGAVALSKTGDKAQAEVGDSVRYTITVSVPSGALPRQTTVVDRLPAGFTYIRGTAMVGDTPIADPQGGMGPVLAFNLGPMPASRQLVLRYRLRVDGGAQQGDGINRARGHACGQPAGCVDAGFNPLPGSVATNDAAFRVRVGGGVFTTDACVLGKVFVDCNGNHVQDAEELGIPGVRLVMQDGTTLISDSEGKYSVCGVPPRSAVLKADPLTLPRGSRLTTSSNRNLGDAGSLWLDLKNGELHRADFIEGSCSNTVLEQVKARRAQGEVRAPEPEKKGGPALRFDSKAHGLTPLSSPQQGTDGANQQAPKARDIKPKPPQPAADETNVPTSKLPMNQPAPAGRDSGTAPGARREGGSDGAR